MMHMLRCAAALLWALTLASPVAAQPADLILRGGRVVTVDAQWRVAQAVAIRAGRFIAVGEDAAIDALRGPQTEIVELGGRTVIPA